MTTPPIRDWIWYKNGGALVTVGDGIPRYQQDKNSDKLIYVGGGLLIALLFRLAQAFGVFDLIQVMTGGGPAGSTESVAIYAYLNAMRFLDFGYSSTVMMGSFILLIIASFIGWLIISQIKLAK